MIFFKEIFLSTVYFNKVSLYIILKSFLVFDEYTYWNLRSFDV